MCGITGYIQLEGSRAPHKSVLSLMNRMLTHRGPDESGHFVTPYCGFASRRLSIIDVTEGHQPVFSQGREIMAVFNGEIYNHIELRKRLKRKGHKFLSTSDSEIIPAMFLEYGPEMVNHFNGMFAIAIWDFRSNEAWLYRDRFGQKPLFTTIRDGVMYFASEIKALLSIPGYEPGLDQQAMQQYLYLGQILSPRTSFAGIHSLPPAFFQRISVDGPSKPFPYWDIELPEQTFTKTSDSEVRKSAKELAERLEESISFRLRSDVPVAGTLSGGLDSSAVLALTSKLSNKPTEAFSITFENAPVDEDDLDESQFQNSVIKKLNLKSNKVDFFQNEDEIGEALDLAYWHYESPDSVVQQEVVFKFLSESMYQKGFKVCLGGEGADEILGGYEWYNSSVGYTKFLESRHLDPNRSTAFLPGKRDQDENWFMNRWGFPSFIYGEELAWSRVQSLFDKGDLPHPFTSSSTTDPANTDFSTGIEIEKLREMHGWNLLQYSDIKIRMPEFILSVQDRFSMAASVEMRSPFLDHNFAQWAVQIPMDCRWRRGREKFLLKKAVEKFLPKNVLARKKQGYTAPLLQSDYGIDDKRVKRLLTKKEIEKSGIFDYAFVKRIKKIDATYPSTRVPAKWLAAPVTSRSAGDVFLERISDIQVFHDIFCTNFKKFQSQHLKHADAADRSAL
ncbi:MAG: asparagine synthase (glutamine-hydrolyzing) [Candidatus Lindowbacteria bacterium]|nr:asparagine synthase (glutamine-hydrolyzing) [Candidatus Lindowbacteria bacterium]